MFNDCSSFIAQNLNKDLLRKDTKTLIRKHFNLLEINESLKGIFNCQPITAFRRNNILKELIGSNKTEKNKFKKRQIQKLKPGKSCHLRSLCCKQVRKTTTFKSQQTKKKNIPQRQLCQKLRYIFDGVHFM